MKKFNITLIALLISSFIVNSQTIDSTLIKAYNHNSKIILDEFFMNWENSFELSNPEFINQNDTVKELYNVLNEFYKLFNDYGVSYSYSPLCDSTKYFVLSDTVRYKICYSETLPNWPFYKDTSKKIIENRVANFKPFYKIYSTKFLYFNDKFINTVFDFFKPATEINEKTSTRYNKKVQFLLGSLKILDKGNIQTPYLNITKLLSDPRISYILVNFKLSKLYIMYSIECSFYQWQWDKANDIWMPGENICLAAC